MHKLDPSGQGDKSKAVGNSDDDTRELKKKPKRKILKSKKKPQPVEESQGSGSRRDPGAVVENSEGTEIRDPKKSKSRSKSKKPLESGEKPKRKVVKKTATKKPKGKSSKVSEKTENVDYADSED